MAPSAAHVLPCLCRCRAAPAPIHLRSTCCRQSSALDYGKVYAGQRQQRTAQAPAGLDFQPPLLIHTALILEPHGCSTQTHPCSKGLGPRLGRSRRFPNCSKTTQTLAENQGLFFPFAAAHARFALWLFPPFNSPDLALYPMDAAACPRDALERGPLTSCQDGSLAARGRNPPSASPASHPGQERWHRHLGDTAACPVLPTGAQVMLLLLLAPSSPLLYSIHHLGCHQGQQDRCPRLHLKSRQASGPGSSGTAPREGDTMSPGRGGRAEQHPGDTDGEGLSQGALRCMPPVPGGCSLFLARSSSPLHRATYPLPPCAWIPWPVSLSHCHKPRCSARHTR